MSLKGSSGCVFLKMILYSECRQGEAFDETLYTIKMKKYTKDKNIDLFICIQNDKPIIPCFFHKFFQRNN